MPFESGPGAARRWKCAALGIGFFWRSVTFPTGRGAWVGLDFWGEVPPEGISILSRISRGDIQRGDRDPRPLEKFENVFRIYFYSYFWGPWFPYPYQCSARSWLGESRPDPKSPRALKRSVIEELLVVAAVTAIQAQAVTAEGATDPPDARGWPSSKSQQRHLVPKKGKTLRVICMRRPFQDGCIWCFFLSIWLASISLTPKHHNTTQCLYGLLVALFLVSNVDFYSGPGWHFSGCFPLKLTFGGHRLGGGGRLEGGILFECGLKSSSPNNHWWD